MKKITALLMVLAISLSLFVSASAAEPYSKGDVDGNGQVLADDARLALRASAKLEELTEQQKAAADVDGSGDVLADDARIILRVSAKLQSFDEKPDEIPEKPSSPVDVLETSGMETGFDAEAKSLYYHFTLTNTSEHYTVGYPTIMVETVGVEGGFDFPIIEAIHPGEVIEIVGVIGDLEETPSGAKVSIFEAVGYDKDGKSVVLTQYTPYTGNGSFGALEVVNPKFFKASVGGKITGTIKNKNSYNVMTAAVYVLRKDSKGRITAIDGLETKDSPVTGISAGGNASFELAAEADIGANDTIVACTDGAEADATFGTVEISAKNAAVSYTGTLGVVFDAKNPDSEKAIFSPQFRVAAFGAKNASGERTVLGVGYITAQFISPGATLKIAAEACTLDSKNGRVESFSITYVGCMTADKPNTSYKVLTVHDLFENKDELGTKVLSGFIANPNNNKVKDVTVCLAVYGESGALQYVTSAMVEEINKKESANIDIPIDNSPYRYEVVVLSWSDVTE